ncbi:class I SAM-dependent methyltransferase [Pseudalkalibacillus salsuginis]|uniref:class I SAM-dependent methyltransferase n=1 Tax=Pseudalkalibacillus salsuginis TaxID=2910972 RepID=UPI001F3179A7|nr:class I SAM-dependent methyltransferase [Pseudalkalibacillus salsuginis]MCF6409547.1 class I SAM-dependent methyltransferase [Pseudalkalibacillus salsuginis]
MLENTGERIIPDEMKPTNGLYLEHIARYYFSLPYVSGRVLDMACGSGYGSHFVAKSKKKTISELIAVDNAVDAIEYASKRYNHPFVQYHVADALNPNLKQEIGTFDTILSFETIEHIPNEQEFVNNLFHLLNPGGMLVLSTPFGQGRNEPCGSPFHYFQLTPEEFENLFTPYPFSNLETYHQRGVTIEPPRQGVKYALGVAVCKK